MRRATPAVQPRSWFRRDETRPARSSRCWTRGPAFASKARPSIASRAFPAATGPAAPASALPSSRVSPGRWGSKPAPPIAPTAKAPSSRCIFRTRSCWAGRRRRMAYKILIVDDDMHIRVLLKATLARAGYAIVEAASAREALNAGAIDKPDLILLDLGL